MKLDADLFETIKVIVIFIAQKYYVNIFYLNWK